MIEPQWWVSLLQSLNSFVSQSETLFDIVAKLADYPIFLIPLFLVVTYIVRGIIKGHGQAKYWALLIVCAAALAVAINLWLQHFIDKARPETALMNAGHLVMKHLPTRSFPSDHAAVSMAVALAALVRGYSRGKKKTIIARWWILFVGSIVMSIARVAVGVHWPTDILAGWWVACVAVCVIFFAPIQKFLERNILRHIVRFEEWLLHLLGIN